MSRYGRQKLTIQKCYKDLLRTIWQCFGPNEFKICQLPWWLNHPSVMVKPVQRGYVIKVRKDGNINVYRIATCIIGELERGV
jgi:hypothetical protein